MVHLYNVGTLAAGRVSAESNESIKPWRMEKNDYLNGIKTVRTMMA